MAAANIKYRISADTAKAKKALAGLEKSAIAVGRRAAVAFTGATAALGLLTARGLKSADALGKTADKLGELPAKLQAFNRAAELTGVASKTAELGLQRLVRRVAEAAQGAGEAQGALRELGIDAKKLATLSATDQFGEIAEALKGVANQSDRVRLSFKLFDSEGVALVNTLRLGKDGLNEIRQEVDDYGLALTRVDVAKVEAANDAFFRAKSVVAGFGQQLAVQVAPVLEEISNSFLQVSKDAGGVGKVAENAFIKTARAVGVVADVLNGLKVTTKGLEVAFAGFASFAISKLNQVGATAATVANVLPFIDIKYDESGLNQYTLNAKARLKILSDELAALLETPPPSDQIDKYIADIIAKSNAAATKAAADASKLVSDVTPDTTTQLPYVQAAQQAADILNGAAPDPAAFRELERSANFVARVLTDASPDSKKLRELQQSAANVQALLNDASPDEKAYRALALEAEKIKATLSSVAIDRSSLSAFEQVASNLTASLVPDPGKLQFLRQSAINIANAAVPDAERLARLEQVAAAIGVALIPDAEQLSVLEQASARLIESAIPGESALAAIVNTAQTAANILGSAAPAEAGATSDTKQAANDAEFDVQSAQYKRLQSLADAELANLYSIENKWQARTLALVGATGKQKAQLAIGTLKQITQGAAQQSKALFNINKIAAIAEALINAKASIVGAYRYGASIGGPPLGAAFAGVAAATTAAQIASIKSTQFGGGTTPSFAGSTGVINDQPVLSEQEIRTQQQPSNVISIDFTGGITDTQSVRDFIAGDFAEALRDGSGLDVQVVAR